ncbi:kinase-like domain-containing protein [Hyaloraphidium curvatum]|nr:kinase-like domain-containing protein [Hyaloraphidium curvatum]
MSNSLELVDFTYCLSSELQLQLKIRITSLEGLGNGQSARAQLADLYARYLSSLGADQLRELYVVCQLWADNKPLAPPSQTSYKSFTSRYVWNEWIQFPVKYRDLPRNAQVAFTVWEAYAPGQPRVVGGTTFRLFGKTNVLRTGKHKLHLWSGRGADGTAESSTLSKQGDPTAMDRLQKLMRRYENGDVPHVDWLDNMVFREIEKINMKEVADSNSLSLYIDLPRFDFPLVFNEKIVPLPSSMTPRSIDSELVIFSDLESQRDNLVEAKHRKLIRSQRNGILDRELKPNAKIRDELNKLLKYPPTKSLSGEEKDLLWKFRYYLTRDRKAVTKFVKSVVWTDPVEARQAADLLPSWADIDVEDALELLGPSFENSHVRTYAVNQLKKADDDDLQLYLVQLVQALKFENLTETNEISESPLGEFLVHRAIRNPTLGNYFYWYLMVECEDKAWGKMYARISYHYMAALMEAQDGFHRRDMLRRSGELIGSLLGISKELRAMKDPRPKKIEHLRHIFADSKNGFLSFPPLPLPLDANVQVTGIIPDKATLFRSVLTPLRISFRCVDGQEYPVMFKAGDDLRQDQLVIQILTLMDKLLRKENLDLKLTPYKVLATGPDHGLVQYIPSLSLAAILEEYGSLLAYLREHNREDTAADTYGISPVVMDTYIKSCAAYCVITYLLGVGDRHMDNLLLSPSGNLFHVDFSFILGRDPKPFPPPMKLAKEMVEAMGGASSQHYQQFKSYCFLSFSILRKSANLILNLFALMVNSAIPDIKIEPDKAVLKVQDKFRLDLSEEEAVQYFQTLINDSVGALFPQVMERIHQWAQYWRS